MRAEDPRHGSGHHALTRNRSRANATSFLMPASSTGFLESSLSVPPCPGSDAHRYGNRSGRGRQPPISTVGKPSTIAPPWTVGSSTRAADRLQINTVIEPFNIASGGPTQVAVSVTRAAGIEPMSTVIAQGGRMGPPTWGTGGVPGVIIGQACMSPTRAAGIPMNESIS